jgi:hypothetical protein
VAAVRSDYDRAVTLDPDVAAHLERLSAQPGASIGEAELAQLRREYDDSAPVLFGPAQQLA